MTKLRKSVRTYLELVGRLPKLTEGQPCPQECTSYLRALYREFGRDVVRHEIAKAKAPPK